MSTSFALRFCTVRVSVFCCSCDENYLGNGGADEAECTDTEEWDRKILTCTGNEAFVQQQQQSTQCTHVTVYSCMHALCSVILQSHTNCQENALNTKRIPIPLPLNYDLVLLNRKNLFCSINKWPFWRYYEIIQKHYHSYSNFSNHILILKSK